MTSDVTDSIWRLLGTAVHYLLDKAADESHTTEERMFVNINGWVISGAADVQHEDGVAGIIDYKVTSVWSVRFDKPEWEQQLNLYGYLVHASKGIKVQRLQICAILRDWRASDAAKDPCYPQQPIVMVEVPVWETGEQLAYLVDRVKQHQMAATKIEFDLELPPCNDQDRWVRNATWAAFKPGGKRAVAVCLSEADAIELMPEGGRIERRGGEPKRCTGNYCGVARWCSQWQRELQTPPQ
jgi:hypothetical protein